MSATTIDRAQAPLRGHAHHGTGRSFKRFFGHFGEMMVSMMVGMAIGGMLGVSRIPNTELKALLWLVAMVVPMVGWMRFRGMSWRQSTEMAVAMAIPTVFGLVAFWTGTIAARSVNSIEHGSMMPAMLALMVYRHRQYGL